MANIKILLASAEAFPFAKVGGLADVAGSLPKPLKEKGIDIRTVIPLYDKIERAKFEIEHSGVEFDVPMGNGKIKGKLFCGKFPETGIPAYFIDCPEFFGRPGIYTDPNTGEGYPDDAERFIFFSKAIFYALKGLDWFPDLIHANDYQTGLIPAIIKLGVADEDFSHTASLYTIHNLAYQGRFPVKILDTIGFGKEHFFPMGPFEFFGEVNLMKIGIYFADIVNTVSPTYAREIQTSAEYGYGLEGLLKSISDRLFGIINGIDTEVWNPAIDKEIPYNFSKDDLSNKRMCKSSLLKEVGLPKSAIDVPMIGIISRLAAQKGFDILIPIMEKIAKENCTMVILGTGDKKYEEELVKIASKYPEKIAVVIGFKNSLSHLIEAGADMFLMPSKYEPCGLNQMYSMAYGTVPIVRKTGGLADTVEPADIDRNLGTGFVFEDYDSSALFRAISSALYAFADQKGWRRLQLRCMEKDFSWSASAEKYLEIYKKAIDARTK